MISADTMTPDELRRATAERLGWSNLYTLDNQLLETHDIYILAVPNWPVDLGAAMRLCVLS